MKKNVFITVLFSFSLFLLISYNSYETTDVSNTSLNPQHIVKKLVDKEEKYFAPFTGEEVSCNTYKNTPFMVIIENSRSARPQSGLSEADLVFETMAEGGIPRFIALFQKNSPKEIGPIRSARPYFIDISKEYNLPFSHCGGSEEALVAIKNEGLMSMDEILNGSYYWRDKSRNAPHNLYSSAENIRKLLINKGYISSPSFIHKFNKEYWSNNSLSDANSIEIKLNRYYTIGYELKNGEYMKTMDNILAVDRSNNNPLTVSNIVIQITDIKLQSDGSHVDVTLVGDGSGYVISNGKYMKVNWSRKDVSSPTLFTDEKGCEVPLAPGKTWWHIADKNINVQFK